MNARAKHKKALGLGRGRRKMFDTTSEEYLRDAVIHLANHGESSCAEHEQAVGALGAAITELVGLRKGGEGKP